MAEGLTKIAFTDAMFELADLWTDDLTSERCLLSTVYCLLSAVCCLLSAVCCLLFAVCCLLSAVCYLLSAVCCLLSDLWTDDPTSKRSKTVPQSKIHVKKCGKMLKL